MRAALGGPHETGGRHISGAERIVSGERIPDTLQELYGRAREHELGCPDYINLCIELVPAKEIRTVTSLPVYTIKAGDYLEGRKLAGKVLELAEIQPGVVKQGFQYLLQGPSSSGSNMRGAILIDVETGHRLDPDQDRGVRASRMDYDPGAAKILSEKLEQFGLNNSHVREALCLATKVACIPGIAAELCWSDDPGYTAGYVASASTGYVRFNYLKEKGSCRGGRVFFFDPCRGAGEEAMRKLKLEPYIITEVGPINGEMTFDQFAIRFKEQNN
jgi:6-carboxyhexanoate--CoA ligase